MFYGIRHVKNCSLPCSENVYFSSIGRDCVSQQVEGGSGVPYWELFREQDNVRVQSVIASLFRLTGRSVRFLSD
jgi:hypothetical protein